MMSDKRTEIRCPECKSTFLARHNGKIVCLNKKLSGEYCKGELPCRRESDKSIPILQEEGW